MKKLSIFLIMLVAVSVSFSQDLNRFPSKLYQKDTLTTAVDTLDVSFNSDLYIKDYIITARTLAGADTVQVWLLAQDALTWVQQGVVGLADLADGTQIIVSTTAKDYLIADSLPTKIRLISTSNDGSSTVVIVAGRAYRAE
jgi:hypothetical protein